MNRQEAILLLKEIWADCESFHCAQTVSIEHVEGSDSWELRVFWVPHPSEIECLEKIVAKHSIEMVTSKGRSVFGSKKQIRSPL